jgi:mannose-6-phosphate isomerase-like protein (cupin superfamily)
VIEKVNLSAELARIDKPWSPVIVGELNGQTVKLARLDGEFVWHQHEHADEMFLVLEGRVRICLRDREVSLGEGEMFVVPRGVEHKPIADEPAHVMLFEPAGTRNTGNVDHAYTVEDADLLRR